MTESAKQPARPTAIRLGAERRARLEAMAEHLNRLADNDPTRVRVTMSDVARMAMDAGLERMEAAARK